MTHGQDDARKKSSAILIAAHGSQLDHRSALPALEQAARLRSMDRFQHVSAAFWREMPSLGSALEAIPHERIVVCPLFISEGFFATRVLPAELGVQPDHDEVTILPDGRHVVLARAVGTHPDMTDVLLERAHALRASDDIDAARCALVIVGHGTTRDSNSARAIHRQVELIGATRTFGEVRALFLDEAPFVHDIHDHITHDEILVVPFFISDGFHTQVDIPDALGRPQGHPPERSLPFRARGKQIRYAGAVGTSQAMTRILLDRIQESLAILDACDQHVEQRPQSTRSARRHLFARLSRSPSTTLGELLVTITPLGWSMRHVRDVEEDPGALDSIDTPHALRLLARKTDSGELRPNPYAGELATGWCVESLNLAALIDWIEAVYPDVALSLHPDARTKLPITPLDEVARRQIGKYRALADYPESLLDRVVTSTCQASCMRSPAWARKDPPEAPLGTCRQVCPLTMGKLADALEKNKSD